MSIQINRDYSPKIQKLLSKLLHPITDDLNIVYDKRLKDLCLLFELLYKFQYNKHFTERVNIETLEGVFDLERRLFNEKISQNEKNIIVSRNMDCIAEQKYTSTSFKDLLLNGVEMTKELSKKYYNGKLFDNESLFLHSIKFVSRNEHTKTDFYEIHWNR